ncbi:MAG: DeoR/GlpR transcriptional regulator [Lachnospiraceae bacterium]|nr:DeoR/GlpR transcriptional regulator [Lachnospiraceae bacterium]
MLTQERFCEILKVLDRKQSVTVQELVEILQTSESTIRRDLTELNRQGKLVKVHGGATAVHMNYETRDADVEVRQDKNKEEKLKIGRCAAGLIDSSDFVYIDAGTTTERMIDFITQKDAIFVTNSAIHARMLSKKGMKVYLLGGEYKGSTEAVVGGEAVYSLQKYHFTKGFWGTNGIGIQAGYTTPEPSEALVKRAAMERTAKRYILSDSSKFSRISSVSFAAFEDATIITTKVMDPAYQDCDNIIEAEGLQPCDRYRQGE